MKGNFVILDCETGGLNPKQNPITQIALIAVDASSLKEIERWETIISPYGELEISTTAIDKTMVTMNDLKKGLDAKQVVSNMIRFFKAASRNAKHPSQKPVIVGHNVSFDVAFISELFALNGKDLFEYVSDNNQVINQIDTLQLSRLFWGGDLVKGEDVSFTLSSCLRRAGLDLNDAHGAMNDVLATLRLFMFFRNEFSKVNKLAKKDSSVADSENNDLKTRRFFKI